MRVALPLIRNEKAATLLRNMWQIFIHGKILFVDNYWVYDDWTLEIGFQNIF